MHRYYIVLSSLGFAHAQTATNTTSLAAKGTYQLVFHSRRDDVQINLTEKELGAIERLRKDNEVVYAQAAYNDYLKIRILPRSEISKKDFNPGADRYYKDEHSYEENQRIRYVTFD